jgi:hypothetical protein
MDGALRGNGMVQGIRVAGRLKLKKYHRKLKIIRTLLGETVVPEENSRLEKNLKGSSTRRLRRIHTDSFRE